MQISVISRSSYVLRSVYKFIGRIRNVRIGSFFNVPLHNALFEFLIVMLNQKLDLKPGSHKS